MLPRERRRRIARAVLRGEAVADPRDAALAVEFAATRRKRIEQFERTWFWRWFSIRHAIVFGGVGVALGIGLHDWLLVAVAAVPALYVVAVRAFVGRLQKRFAAAQEQNERLL